MKTATEVNQRKPFLVFRKMNALLNVFPSWDWSVVHELE